MRKKKYAGKLMIGMIMGMLACNAFSIQAAASVTDGTAEMEDARQTISDEIDRPEATKKKGKNIWIKCGVVAACFCIVVAGIMCSLCR